MDNPDDLFDILVARLVAKVQYFIDSDYEPDEADVAKLAQLEAAIQGVERASKVLLGYR